MSLKLVQVSDLNRTDFKTTLLFLPDRVRLMSAGFKSGDLNRQPSLIQLPSSVRASTVISPSSAHTAKNIELMTNFIKNTNIGFLNMPLHVSVN
jgi:hypothetical protein